MTIDTVHAVTSLPPAPRDPAYLQRCIRSWRAAGLKVVAFNHPDEIASLSRLFDVEFVPVTNTSHAAFGAHYVPINAMLDWAREHDARVLLINADIELRLSPSEFSRLRWLADDGLLCLCRHNYDTHPAACRREPYGIDGFLLHGRHATLFAPSFLSMGQPAWDYWLPERFLAAGLGVHWVDAPVALHRNHALGWSWAQWVRCALEFGRLTGRLGHDHSDVRCHGMCLEFRHQLDANLRRVPAAPFDIRAWVQARFAHAGPKTMLELGSHMGTDTEWMARLPQVTLHAFEPDPRNMPATPPNVVMHRAAIAEHDGRIPFTLSREGWGREWTYSSSIRAPKNHLSVHPVSFGPTIEVDAVSLDSFACKAALAAVDFIWADIQGAEVDMIRGGRRTLARTRYLYTEYSNDELYEGQVSLSDIMAMLPDYRVLELWPGDVLLENRAFDAHVASQDRGRTN